MGVLTDYFRTTDRDAARALVAERELGPLVDHPGLAPVDGVGSTGIDPFVVLPALVAAVDGARAESDDDAPLVWPDADDQEAMAEGPWVVELSEETRDVLASLAEEDIDPVAARWATSDELDDATGEDLRPFVVDLAALARRAADAGDRLYCWTCL